MKITCPKIVFLLIVIVALVTAVTILLNPINLFSKIVKGINNEVINGEPIDISKVPIFTVTADDYGRLFYIDRNIKRKVTHNYNTTSNLYFSPSIDKFGYIENFDIFDKNAPYDQEIILHIGNTKTRETKIVYHGSFKTSGWEWFSNNEVLVSYGCGTECQTIYIINVDTGKKYTLGYGVGYEWSPDKKMVVAYHYYAGSGITIGDKFGNILFRLLRERPDIYSELLEQTMAYWSPDSNKIAVVIKKENQDQLELLIFNVQENFKQIFQSDVDFFEDTELRWDNNEKLVYNNKAIEILNN